MKVCNKNTKCRHIVNTLNTVSVSTVHTLNTVSKSIVNTLNTVSKSIVNTLNTVSKSTINTAKYRHSNIESIGIVKAINFIKFIAPRKVKANSKLNNFI